MAYQIDWIDGEKQSRKRAKTAERVRRHRAKKAEAGLVNFSAMVHPLQLPELRALCDMLAANPDLVVMLARDQATGRFVKVK